MKKQDVIYDVYISKMKKKPKTKIVKQNKVFKMKSDKKLKVPGKYDEEIQKFLSHIK